MELPVIIDYTALHIAVEKKNIEIIKLLIKYPKIDLNKKNGIYKF